MQQMELNRILREKAISLGADFFGVSDLTLARDAIVEQGGDELVEFPRGISMGIALMNTIVDQLPQRARKAVAVSYRHHCYNVINQRLDLITSVISGYLQQAGYKALPIPASERVDDERICSLFSHKLAAHLAGLGWIGKSCLLINPEVGPRARWATVLVGAPLEPTG